MQNIADGGLDDLGLLRGVVLFSGHLVEHLEVVELAGQAVVGVQVVADGGVLGRQRLGGVRVVPQVGTALAGDLLGGRQLLGGNAAELNLNDVVRFSGTVPYGKPLFDAWADANVMVITNLTAEISRNVLLGMARGLPLIVEQHLLRRYAEEMDKTQRDLMGVAQGG